MEKKNTCFVCEYGWIIVGKFKSLSFKDLETKVVSGQTIYLEDAAVVRNWNNGRGIGGIAKSEFKDEYRLDPIGDVNIRSSKVLFEIPCEW